MANRKYKLYKNGMIEATLLLYGGAALAAIAFITSVYFYGRSAGKDIIQAKWDKQTSEMIVAAETKRKKDVAAITRLVQENLAAQAEIDKLSAEIKLKGIANDTSKFCPSAPAGSVLVTSDRLHDLKSLYRK